jgi:hypothetical protein
VLDGLLYMKCVAHVGVAGDSLVRAAVVIGQLDPCIYRPFTQMALSINMRVAVGVPV